MSFAQHLISIGLLDPQARHDLAQKDFALARVWYGFMTARVMIAVVLLVLQASIHFLGQPVSPWIFGFCVTHLLATLLVRVAARPKGPGQSFDPQWLPTIGVDLIAYSVLQLVQLGNINYTPLFALPVLLASVLGSALLALGTAAGMALLLLADAWWMGLQGMGDAASRFLQAGLTGIGFFVVALLANQLAARLVREEQEARRSQLAARTQIQVNELVIETLVDGVLVVDANGIVRVVNPAARRMLGTAGQQRATPFVLAAEVAWQPLVELARLTFVRRSSQTSDTLLLHDAENSQRIQVRTRLTTNHGNESESLCVMFLQDLREIEARIRTEKLAAMGRMSAAVAHEIRNPLAAIAQANALLMEDLSGPEHQQLARMVDQNAQRLARIVDDVLNLARVQDVATADRAEYLHLDAVVETACDEWARQTGSGSRLLVQTGAPRAVVQFDEEHLRRVLVNLLDNALRYAGYAAQSIRVTTQVARPQSALLTVWSDGAPLETSVQAHLFEPFFSSESRSSGLGLYICRGLCERHGAMIGYQRATRGDIEGNEFFVDCQITPAKLAQPDSFDAAVA
jgi:two-component system sensor histidine kinase PilS (NtrC family)